MKKNRDTVGVEKIKKQAPTQSSRRIRPRMNSLKPPRRVMKEDGLRSARD